MGLIIGYFISVLIMIPLDWILSKIVRNDWWLGFIQCFIWINILKYCLIFVEVWNQIT